MKSPKFHELEVHMRQTDPNSYKEVLADIKTKEIHNFIIDTKPKHMHHFLRMVINYLYRMQTP